MVKRRSTVAGLGASGEIAILRTRCVGISAGMIIDGCTRRRSSGWRALPFGVALAFLITSSIGPAQGTARCRAVPPPKIAGGPVTWLGPCVNGAAHGVGTLRITRGSGRPHLFYGRMVRGRPFSGVLSDQEGGIEPVWRFDAQLRPVDDPSGNMQSTIDSLDLAAAGAMEASRRYRAQGNMAAARYYAKQSEQLTNQIE